MQITYKGDYALKAILYLAQHYGQGVVTIHELAKSLDIPIKFLEQVLLELKQGGFTDSKRGIKGGYFLTRKPRDIILGDVIRFIDGPIEPIPCASLTLDYKGCQDQYKCAFRDVWIDVARSISGIVDHITFQDLIERMQVASKKIIYQI